jgi:molybdate transport system substrate-binding protein
MKAGMRWVLLAVAVISGLVVGAVGGGASVAAEPASVATEPLTLAAAPSLKPVLQKIVPMFESEYGATVRVEYGPSQVLRRQIEKGAPIDVFLPAGVKDVEYLYKKGLTADGGPRIYAQTSLVLVMSAASQALAVSFREGLPDRATRIALGDPKTSALGDITARALAKLDPGYRARTRLLYGQDSEEIVNLIQRGQAEVGIVYRVDALNSGHVRIIDEAPTGRPTPVQFAEAVVWTCRPASLPVAEEFLHFMLSPRIQKLLVQYGFDPLG